MNSVEFINVPVPKDRVQEVYELLSQRPTDDDTPAPSLNLKDYPPEVLAFVMKQGEINWPEDLLIRAYRESPPAMRVVLDHLSANAGRQVNADQLAKIIEKELGRPGYGRDQLAGVLGAFGRRWKNRYGRGSRESGAWPFQASWNDELKMNEYMMPLLVAEVFLRAAEQYRSSRV